MVRRSLVQTTYLPEIWLLLACSTFLNPVTARGDPLLAESTDHWSSLTRRSLFPSSASSKPAPTTVQPQAAGTPSSNPACVQPPITNTTWIQLGIDNYLANLPNGASLNLQHYAASVGAPDFICGIGEKCQAGQLCSPVQAPGWEVLVAAQEWNNYQNRFYEAVGTAVQMVTSISSSLVSDLYPPSHTGEIWDVFNTFNLAAGITSGIVGMFFAFIGLAVVASTPLSLLVLPAVAVVFGYRWRYLDERSSKEFYVYTSYLSEWKKHSRKGITNGTRSIIASGVSSPQGISTVLKIGTFFHERPSLNEAELVASLKNTTTVRILTDILRSQRAFVTIASVSISQPLCHRILTLIHPFYTQPYCGIDLEIPKDKCTGKGPGGAWKVHNNLSYCSPNGTMFNIIHASKKKVHNKWWNADLIAKKYGVSVQYLTEQSYFCQLNHGAANFDPYKSSSFPKDLSAECISNLPVCDFRNPDLAEAKKEKNTIYACRHVAKLPI
ncbi:uncharacterized protein PGTG_06412 [Puccinia graminis f. sp. tritici CRL 75-36-700-3]|uniref:DUF7872 domain-containing protein n=1 Tax=Puccinia graminis f. sp. tritici (strain CRL 75-36-700-3 / race SCCL) TaxID=418459 RepID=E3K7D6_PUCGT|nr:uncharacterized protein PGTG_06412 [Puccinia graminis f. sp. tritici CRL 75-36-700-3]EFP80456.2 hypothetical protein PGTG_06412 [Puccinia graminis f. sp. tritici CRL 75-36-700-3]